MITPILQRLQPPPVASPASRDRALEGVRGACAALVFYAHLFLPYRVVDPVWTPSPRFLWGNLGLPAVLIFFVISGYVIGLVTTGPASGWAVRHYLIRRATRLVPINIFAVLISWMLLAHLGWRTVTGNLLFLQNTEPYPLLGSFPLLVNNPNLWSLNYEAVFYLGFIVVWFIRPRAVWVFAGLLLLLCTYTMGGAVTRMVASYSFGALYWLGGLTVAWLTAHSSPAERTSNWPGALLTAYAVWIFSPLQSLGQCLGLNDWVWPSLASPSPMSPHRLDFLLPALWLLLAVTGRSRPNQRRLAWICLSLATAGLAARVRPGAWQEVDTLAAISLTGAWAIAWRNYSLRPLEWLAPLGTVSYAIYAIAAPFQLGQRVLWPSLVGTAWTFTLRLVVVVAVVGAVAWLLECRLSPPIQRWIRSRENRADEPKK